MSPDIIVNQIIAMTDEEIMEAVNNLEPLGIDEVKTKLFDDNFTDDEIDSILNDLSEYELPSIEDLEKDLEHYINNPPPLITIGERTRPNSGTVIPIISRSPKMYLRNGRLHFRTNSNLLEEGSSMEKRLSWFKFAKFPGRSATNTKLDGIHPFLALYRNMADSVMKQTNMGNIEHLIRRYVTSINKVRKIFNPDVDVTKLNKYRAREIISDIHQIIKNTQVLRRMCDTQVFDINELYQLLVGQYYDTPCSLSTNITLCDFITQCVKLHITEPFHNGVRTEAATRGMMIRTVRHLMVDALQAVRLSGIVYPAVRVHTFTIMLQNVKKYYEHHSSVPRHAIDKLRDVRTTIESLASWLRHNKIVKV